MRLTNMSRQGYREQFASVRVRSAFHNGHSAGSRFTEMKFRLDASVGNRTNERHEESTSATRTGKGREKGRRVAYFFSQVDNMRGMSSSRLCSAVGKML